VFGPAPFLACPLLSLALLVCLVGYVYVWVGIMTLIDIPGVSAAAYCMELRYVGFLV
jgi:hypothetical protein